jgi:hypothetical protein
MPNHWLALGVEAAHSILDQAVGVGDALMLAEMFEP